MKAQNFTTATQGFLWKQSYSTDTLVQCGVSQGILILQGFHTKCQKKVQCQKLTDPYSIWVQCIENKKIHHVPLGAIEEKLKIEKVY